MSLTDLINRWLRRTRLPDARFNTIPTVSWPEGRPRTIPPKAPKKRGVPPAEYEVSLQQYRQAYRRHFAEIAAFERKRRIALGITEYKWIAVEGSSACSVARRNDGKIFSYSIEPLDGHPMEGRCDSIDWCRCMAKSFVRGFT